MPGQPGLQLLVVERWLAPDANGCTCRYMMTRLDRSPLAVVSAPMLKARVDVLTEGHGASHWLTIARA